MTASASAASARATQIWIERAGGAFVAGAWFAPRGAHPRSTGVLIVAGPAHEERTMAGGLMACADALAGRGFGALCIDLHGVGQSSGRLDDADLGSHWRADLRAAVAEVRRRGFDSTIVVGVRLGALLAADAIGGPAPNAPDTPDAPLGFVGWMPVVSGRRHLRELRLLAQAAPHVPLSIGGFDWPAGLVEQLGSLELSRIQAGAALLLDADDRSSRAFCAACAACTAPVERRRSTDSSAWLFGNRDEPPLPWADIATLVGWCVGLDDRRAATTTTAGPAPRRSAEGDGGSIVFEHRGRRVREEAVAIGAGRLHGVFCRPDDAPARGAVRLLASTVGPGRTFVDFARDQAAAGHASLRFDFAGFGISPPGKGTVGGRVYAPGGCDDVDAAIDHLRAAGHTRIVLVGYCAGAWSMLQAAARLGRAAREAARIEAVITINAQLQHRPDPAGGPARRAAPVARLARRLARWRALRRVARWLERTAGQEPLGWVTTLTETGVPLLLAYADRDPGLVHLQRRADTLAWPGVQVDIIERLGHLADDTTARARLFARIADYLAPADPTHTASIDALESAPDERRAPPSIFGALAGA